MLPAVSRVIGPLPCVHCPGNGFRTGTPYGPGRARAPAAKPGPSQSRPGGCPARPGTQETTVTGPMPNSRTGSAITEASPTRTTTRRSSGKALTTAAVASTVPVAASRA